jgi:hypothetical protein
MPKLFRGGVLIGTLTVTGSDWPWHIGEWRPEAAFEPIRSLFEEEIRLLDADGVSERWEAIWDEIYMPGIQLLWEDGHTDTEVLLHIEGSRADWRSC